MSSKASLAKWNATQINHSTCIPQKGMPWNCRLELIVLNSGNNITSVECEIDNVTTSILVPKRGTQQSFSSHNLQENCASMNPDKKHLILIAHRFTSTCIDEDYPNFSRIFSMSVMMFLPLKQILKSTLLIFSIASLGSMSSRVQRTVGHKFGQWNFCLHKFVIAEENLFLSC